MIALTADHLLYLRGLVRRRIAAGTVTSLPGGIVVRPRGRGLETADLRPFEPGDDPRHLDRNATARIGQPQVRLFHAERDQTTLLIGDFRPSMLWGTRRTLRSIAAAEALALVGWQTISQGGRVGLIIATAGEPVLVAPRARDRAMVRAIGAMVRAHRQALSEPMADDPALAETLALAHRIAPRGADVVLASALDHPGPAFAERALALNSRASLRVIRISDPFETEAPAGRYRFATRHDPRGRTGRPAVPDQSPDIAAQLGLPLSTYHAQRPPEEQPHG